MTRFLDLSVTLDDVPSERVGVRIRYLEHREGAEEMGRQFGVPPSALPDGLGWAGEELCLVTHAGTHMDAPWHYGPLSEGKPAARIADVPLDWCLAPGVVLDFTGKADGEEIHPHDLEAAFARIGHRPRPGEIVLLMTGADRHWGSPDYPDRGCGLGGDATLWLVERGVRVIGIDAWGLDRSFAAMRADYERTGDVGRIWAAHFAGRRRSYCQLEKLTGLHGLPSTGFTVACFPVKVARASAGWTRVVAILEDGRP